MAQPCDCFSLLYKCFARSFEPGAPPVLYLLASGFQERTGYELFFRHDDAFAWTLMERVPELAPYLVTWYTAAATTAQPVLDAPPTVRVSDAFGTHEVAVERWDGPSSAASREGGGPSPREAGRGWSEGPGEGTPSGAPPTAFGTPDGVDAWDGPSSAASRHLLPASGEKGEGGSPARAAALDYRVFSRPYDPDGAPVLFVLAAGYYPTGGWRLFFEWPTLMETAPGMANQLITYYQASFTTSYGTLPVASVDIRDGYGVHEVAVTPWS